MQYMRWIKYSPCDSAEADDTPDDPSMESHPITSIRLSKPARGAGVPLTLYHPFMWEFCICYRICFNCQFLTVFGINTFQTLSPWFGWVTLSENGELLFLSNCWSTTIFYALTFTTSLTDSFRYTLIMTTKDPEIWQGRSWQAQRWTVI